MNVKQESTQIVDTLPDEVLNELLEYLRQVEKSLQEKVRLSLNLKIILSRRPRTS